MKRFTNGCIVLKSIMHGDTYAHEIPRSVDVTSKESVIALAEDFASTLALDDSETLAVFVVDERDPGAARLGDLKRLVGTVRA